MRGLALAVLLGSLAASGCATSRAVPRPYPGGPPAGSPHPGPVPTPGAGVTPGSPARTLSPFADTIVETARGLVGAPYRSGGADPRGFDCSGFVQFVFGSAGAATLPRSVRELWQTEALREADAVAPGDLVFFAIDRREVSHVGIALDEDSFVHAPSARGVVRVERLSAAYWATRFAGARRIPVLPTSDAGRPPLGGLPSRESAPER